MDRIILIETSTALCSTALAEDGKVIAYKESSAMKAHASMTAQFIHDMLEEHHLQMTDISGVCISMGPGSYTGLRVGVSTAKGLCFGAGVPLLAVGTLDTLAWQGISGGLLPEGCRHIVAMVDARRMEAYTAVFSPDGRQERETEAEIFTEESYRDLLQDGPVLFIGDAAEKCSTLVSHENAYFHQCCPKASSMLSPAMKELKEKRFKDVAYFEPFYLKEFVATVSKKKLF